MVELVFGLMAVVASAGVILDGGDRKLPAGELVFHAAACLVLFVFALPWYMAIRPLKEGEVREGGRGWNMLRYFALTWTVMNGFLLVAWLIAASQQNFLSSWSVTRYVLLFNPMFLGLLWFWPMVSAVLLGFFLKNAALIERGPTGSLAVESREPAPLSLGEVNLGWASGPGSLDRREPAERDSEALFRRPPRVAKDPEAARTRSPMLLRTLVVPPPYRSRRIVLDGLKRRLGITFATHDGPEATIEVVLRRVELRDDAFFIVADAEEGGHRIELALDRLTRIADRDLGEDIEPARFRQILAGRVKTHGYSW